MQAFSRAMVDIYEAAEQTPVSAFPHEIMRVAKTLFHFDGAVLGAGEAHGDGAPRLTVDDSFVFERDPGILLDYAEVAATDPVTSEFLGGLPQPLAFDCQRTYQHHRLSGLQRFTARHEITHLLLFGDKPQPPLAAKWLVLYRDADSCFSQGDSNYLQALWPHLSRALSINRTRHIDRTLGTSAGRAAALLNLSGRFEVADAHFRTLLDLEWPGSPAFRIPAALLQTLKAGRRFMGRQIHVSAQAMQGYFLCSIVRKSRQHLLTPTELLVSSQYAAGLSTKEIAKRIGLSHHTVRSHIAHSYDKLEINNKAQLAIMFASDSSSKIV